MYSTADRSAALALLGKGRSLNSVSVETGISRAALRDWRQRGVAVRRPSAPCPHHDGAPVKRPRDYVALLGFYLGDGCLSSMRSVFALRVACDQNYPGIIADITRLVHSVHPASSVQHVRAPGVVVVQNYWKHWPCLFPQHGPGRKHERKLELERWQRELVHAHPADLLRGLFHSDGCRAKNWTRRLVAGEMKRYDYPRWQFTNNSQDIRDWCCEALDMLDIAWRQSNWKTISVSTRAGVARLDELIGIKT